LIKVEAIEKYRIAALSDSRLHRRWPKVADALIKALSKIGDNPILGPSGKERGQKAFCQYP
jgi:hypothetical protein